MVATAMAKAASADKEKVRASLETSIREYPGVGGVFSFTPEKHWGLAKRDVAMIEWRGGKFRLVEV